MDISGKIAQCNGRLRAAHIGVAIEQHGARLALRATFSPKPQSNRQKPFQHHECFHLDLSHFPIVRALETTKTGSREVWPCYPEWAERWNLQDRVLPPIRLDRTNEKIGHSVTAYLSPKLPFVPYDLRHAGAIRTSLFGWPVELAARQMGHSVDLHVKTYHRWINREYQQRIYDLLVNRTDRPRPPSVIH